jgi:membrane-bound lytic murein transglycosylase B
MFRFILFFVFTVLVNLNALSLAQTDDTLEIVSAQSFASFLDDIRAKAMKQGVSKTTLDNAFTGLTPNPKVLQYDRNQAEFTLNFWRYLISRVSDKRLEKGKIKLQENQTLLQKTHKKYGVHPSILVAFWGLETNYGKNVGKMNLVRSLATLSFDLRRREFFTRELLALLKLIDSGKLAVDAEGSWAGAMGNTQFMPSNVAAYAIDSNGDGKLGLWDSKADIFASSANFLQNIGWHKGEKWGREVKIGKNFDFSLSNLKTKKTVNAWQDLGVRRANGNDLPNSDMPASLVLPMGFKGPAFLVYRNFHAILRWNRSILYAISVGHLADKLNNNQPLIAKKINEPSLNRADIFYIQTQLEVLGFDSGAPDGISGPKTRAATRSYQQANNLVIDGYVGYQLLQQLKNKNGY